jgi:hypothetical protein
VGKDMAVNSGGLDPRVYAAGTRLGDDEVFIIGGWDPEAKGSGGSYIQKKLLVRSLLVGWFFGLHLVPLSMTAVHIALSSHKRSESIIIVCNHGNANRERGVIIYMRI